MSFRKRLLIFFGILLLAGAGTALFAPFLVANGIRLWVLWAARSEGISVEIERIEAPFLRDVAIHGLHVRPAKTAPREINLQASNVVLDLNFRRWIFGRRARFLRTIAVDQLAGSVRTASQARGEKLDWRRLHELLPDNFRIGDLDLDVETDSSTVSLRGLILSASQIESGEFFARRIFVSSPYLRQTFVDLRGATSWEGSRLTIAGISLARGLDLEAATIDLSQLAKRRLGIDLHLDTFGGTLRASFQGRAEKKFAIDLAGSAVNISLAQISSALGFLEPITGSVRASKFTFRGNPGEFLDATASVWIELADFAWRARRADTVMLGATYYDRRLEVDQLYVRQHRNELTLNGELLWPKQPVRWANLQFRGRMDASIPDLNAFAQLFGAQTGDLAGAVSTQGEIDSMTTAAHGQLAFHGQGVSFRGVALDSLGGSIQFNGSEAVVENFALRHGDDFIQGQGTLDLAPNHRYSARLTGAVNNLAAYAPLLPAGWRSAKIAGGVTFDWSGDGTFAAHSGTFQAYGHGLQLPVAPLRSPLAVTLEGTYSPQDIFFRTFQLANDRASLGGFLMLGSNFIELQALQLILDDAPKISGTLFLPFGVDRLRRSHSFFEAFDERQKFDVDLVVDHLDLGEFVAALGETPTVTGVLDGKVAAYGAQRSLQVTINGQLENLGPTNVPNATEFGLRYADGRAEVDAKAIFGASDPCTLRASLPLRLEKRYLQDRALIDPNTFFSLALDCPALFFETTPNLMRPLGASSGLVSGRIAFSNSLRNPQISGEAQLLNIKLNPGARWPALTDLDAQIQFESTEATIPSLRLGMDGIPLAFRGRLTTTATSFLLSLWPVESEIGLALLPASGDCLSTVRVVGEGTAPNESKLRELLVQGNIGSSTVSLTMKTGHQTNDDQFSQTTLFFCPDAREADPLLLDVGGPERPSSTFELREQRP